MCQIFSITLYSTGLCIRPYYSFVKKPSQCAKNNKYIQKGGDIKLRYDPKDCKYFLVKISL